MRVGLLSDRFAEQTGEARRGAALRRVRPPVPHEHGAWVMLFVPIVMVVAAFHVRCWFQEALLAAGVTGAFFLQHVCALAVRRRTWGRTLPWALLYLLGTMLAAVPLVIYGPARALARIAALAVALFALRTLLSVYPRRRRLDRSMWGESIGAAASALTAPAAYAIATGRLDGLAICLWACCALFLMSGVFYVKTLVLAHRVRTGWGPRERMRIGATNVIYHVLLGLVVCMAVESLGGSSRLFVLLAYAPVVVRGIAGWLTADFRDFRPVRVGMLESAYCVWFCVAMALALRLGLA